jgi:hypothetical protein
MHASIHTYTEAIGGVQNIRMHPTSIEQRRRQTKATWCIMQCMHVHGHRDTDNVGNGHWWAPSQCIERFIHENARTWIVFLLFSADPPTPGTAFYLWCTWHRMHGWSSVHVCMHMRAVSKEGMHDHPCQHVCVCVSVCIYSNVPLYLYVRMGGWMEGHACIHIYTHLHMHE